RAARHAALAALAPLVARRPAWLHRLPAHPLARDLLRAARAEREPLPLLHALLALAALLPAAPALAAPHCAELADALLRPAALDPPPPPPTRAHLQLAQLALFHALYATHPCTLLDALRADLAAAGARDAWERHVAPLLASVRLHPALVTGSRQREADAARWARVEPHDVLAECRRLALHAGTPPVLPRAAASPAPPAASPAPGSGAHAARAASALRPGAEPWFPLGERCGADSAPHTPLPADADAAEPPEAAVEATPENTPARETRAQFRFPTDSGAARAIGRRKETSPGGEAYAARLARVALERRAADSPVPFGGAPPAGASLARPEPRPAGAAPPEPLGAEDREVLELTGGRAAPQGEWAECTTPAPPTRDPRARSPTRARARGAGGAPARRAASCGPRLGGARTCSTAAQTVDVWPAPYEFIVSDFYRCPPEDPHKQIISGSASARLDAYLAELYAGRRGAAGGAGGGAAELGEQLALAHAQLLYERWRREAHAERNRRLLGRCRQARALELQNQALRERARAVQRERDELRARLARDPPAAPLAAAAAAAAEREARLEAALAEERTARLRAEAALHEAEAQRARDAAELRRSRGESHEAARHVEALARAALAAERRAECVRRLRRELLVLSEREARLAGAARAGVQRAGCGDGGAEARSLRAAAARAEAEAGAAAARAEAAAARAHELEAALAARDAAAAELRRAARHAAEEGEARLRAARDKYAALLRVVRAGEARRLERLAAAGGARAGPGGAAAPAGGGGRQRGRGVVPAAAGGVQPRAAPAGARGGGGGARLSAGGRGGRGARAPLGCDREFRL
ncbi:hamartin, partial [Ostrinia nubilalis]|uniref:hamartin n=1 Tax=Ostrinia nubilalis TaxID=29057 RepID=UPI0030824C9B